MIKAWHYYIFIGAFAAPAFGQTLQSAPEPPIIDQQDIGGHYRVQIFELGAVDATLLPMSIAEQYAFQADLAQLGSPDTLPVQCEIADDGTINTRCHVRQDGADVDGYLSAEIGRFAKFLNAPSYKKIDRLSDGTAEVIGGLGAPQPARYVWGRAGGRVYGKKLHFYRLANLTIRFPKTALPLRNDPATGQIVPLSLFPEMRRAVMDSQADVEYPNEASKHSIKGLLTLMCQIQADLSMICQQTAFDPPGGEKYFVNLTRHAFQHVRAHAVLPDGRSSIGLRIQTNVRMVWLTP